MIARLSLVAVVGLLALQSQTAFAAEHAACACSEDGDTVTLFFTHRPQIYGQIHGMMSVDVGSGCVETIDCDTVDGWDRGHVEPLAWDFRSIPNLGRA
jgi:hypothetical protein